MRAQGAVPTYHIAVQQCYHRKAEPLLSLVSAGATADVSRHAKSGSYPLSHSISKGVKAALEYDVHLLPFFSIH